MLGYREVKMKKRHYSVHSLVGHNFLAEHRKPGLEILHGNLGPTV